MEFNGEISVTYEGGVLRPDERLNLPEGTRLRVSLRDTVSNPAAAARALDEIRGISRAARFRSGGTRLTRDQMHERR